MRPREWVAVHRKHHAATDTAEDPHSPLVVGFWRVQLGNVGLYKRVASDTANTRKYARDIPQTAIDKLAFDYSLVGLGIGIAILVVGMCAPRLPAVGRVPRGRHPRRHLRDAVGRDQRHRPPPRQAALRQLRDQRAAPRARDGRRRPAQQPPRRAHVGALRARSGARSIRAGGSCARWCSSASRVSATTTSSSRPPRSRGQGFSAFSTERSWSGPQKSAGAGVVTPLSM